MPQVQHYRYLSVLGGLPYPAFHSISLRYFYSYFFSFLDISLHEKAAVCGCWQKVPERIIFFCEICFVYRSGAACFHVLNLICRKKIKTNVIFEFFLKIFAKKNRLHFQTVKLMTRRSVSAPD